MSLARNIRYLRKKQGWGQDFLAEKLGYKSYTTIQKWESGVSEPPLKMVHALAKLFNVDINDLTNCNLETDKAITDPCKHTSRTVSMQAPAFSHEEYELIRKFRLLDDRGRSAVLNVLNHEYESLPGEKAHATPKEA